MVSRILDAFAFLSSKTYRFDVSVGLCSHRSQRKKTSNDVLVESIIDTRGCTSLCATFLFLPHGNLESIREMAPV